MTSEADFVAASVHHQLGRAQQAELTLSDPAVDLAKSVASGMGLFWDAGSGAPSDFNGWYLDGKRLRKKGAKVNRTKVAGALQAILDHDPDVSFFIDMADHRARSLTTKEGEAAPVFCFNRPVAKPAGRVLWPLPGYHDLDADTYLGARNLRDIPWAEKRSRVIWRGSAGGWARLGKYGRGRMIRMHALLRKFKKGAFRQDEVMRALATIDRHRFVLTCLAEPMFDVGYTHFGGFDLAEFPMLDPFVAPRISAQQQTSARYLAVLPGADIGSNFYWVMNSSSLGLVMTPEFESFASCHFQPWIHYVPFRADLSDLRSNLEWCEQNPDRCQDMIRKANGVCDMLADDALRRKVLGRVVTGLCDDMRGRKS